VTEQAPAPRAHGRRAPGRPRDPEVDRAILAATFRLLVDEGYASLSIEAVAAAAGVGKTTIYRRHPTKRDLVVAAIAAGARIDPPPAETGTRAAMGSLIRQAVHALLTAHGVRILGTLLVEERREPDLLDVFRARLLEPRRSILLGILRTGIERGEVRPDADLDVVTEMILGSVIAHYVRTGRYDEDGWVEAVLETAWAAVAVRD
jgi:AcrR family transcriptional regulator